MKEKLQEHFSIIKASQLFKSLYAGIENYTDAPILEKYELVTILKEDFDIHKEEKGVYLIRSGGSSHKPLVFPVDIEENITQRQLLANELSRVGIFTPKTVALNLFSYMALYRTSSIFDDLLERCQATTLAASNSAPHDLVYSAAKLYKPNMILGTPSKLVLFSKFMQYGDRKLEIKNVLFGGEFLLPSQKKILEETFNTQQIYSLYGSAETGIWAWSNYSKNPLHFHFLKEIIIEIFEPNDDGFGDIVVTNLLRKRFPLFRYKMGDIGKLEVIEGVETLVLASREDNSFSIHADSYFLKDFEEALEEIDRFQFQISLNTSIQTEINVLLIKAGTSSSEKELFVKNITEGINKHLKCDPQFTILVVKFVDETEFYSDPTTSKSPKIKDFRD
ncbi:MAG: hypothetical protein JKY02_01760 [Flavobacteriaceae bacterium]|nr:hypothetical protein [Flavobacteriaceae bacterium]